MLRVRSVIEVDGKHSFSLAGLGKVMARLTMDLILGRSVVAEALHRPAGQVRGRHVGARVDGARGDGALEGLDARVGAGGRVKRGEELRVGTLAFEGHVGFRALEGSGEVAQGSEFGRRLDKYDAIAVLGRIDDV